MSTRTGATAGPDPTREALAAVRSALLDDAVAEATRIGQTATRDADEAVSAATAERDAALATARDRAASVARLRAGRTAERTRAQTHREVLESGEELRRRLVDEVHAAVTTLREDPGYPGLLELLEELARDRLGPAVTIRHDPGGGGGLEAVSGPLRVDYTLVALADRALETLADDVAELWS